MLDTVGLGPRRTVIGAELSALDKNAVRTPVGNEPGYPPATAAQRRPRQVYIRKGVHGQGYVVD